MSRLDSARAHDRRLNQGMMLGFQMANNPEVSAAISALLQDEGTHMRMAPKRAVALGDSARAATIVQTARGALGKYKDVKVAEADGYREFMPWLANQPIYHYNNLGNASAVVGPFDATKPISLLYKKNDKGEMTLVGAMYSALPSSTPEELDARMPTSIANWHEHVNFCAANRDSVRAGAVKTDPATVAHWLRINTPEECSAMGGRFVPRVFGWMAHVYMFAGDDPKAIWGEHGSMDMDMHHPGM
jgi:hypothetical protein